MGGKGKGGGERGGGGHNVDPLFAFSIRPNLSTNSLVSRLTAKRVEKKKGERNG